MCNNRAATPLSVVMCSSADAAVFCSIAIFDVSPRQHGPCSRQHLLCAMCLFCLPWRQLQHQKPGFCPADTPSATAATNATATAALEMGPEYVQVEPACDAYRWGVAVSVTKSSRRRVFFRFATFFANFSSSSLCTPIVGIVNVTFFNEVLQTLFRRRNDEWYYNS